MSESGGDTLISRPDTVISSSRGHSTPSEVSPVATMSNTIQPHEMASDEKYLVIPELDSTPSQPPSSMNTEKQVNSQTGPPEYSEKQSSTDAEPSQSVPRADTTAPDALEKEMAMQSGNDKIAVQSPTVSETAPSSSVSTSGPVRPASRSYFEYGFYTNSGFINIIICDPHRLAVYYANMTVFTRGRADVTIHDLSSTPSVQKSGSSLKSKEGHNAKVAAVAEFVSPGKNIKLGFGDPENVEDVRWLVMKNVPGDNKGAGEKYELTISASEKQPRRDFQWVMGGDPSSSSKDSFWVVSGGRVLASYKSASLASWKKKGALRLYDIPEMDELRLMICLSSAALCERQRRVTVKKSLLMG